LLTAASIFSYIYDNIGLPPASVQAISQALEKANFFTWFYRAFFWHFVFGLSLGAGVLTYRFIRNKQIIVRQRLKWRWRARFAAVVPVIFYQVAKSSLDLPQENWLTSLQFCL
jgi:hypothetical protein